MLELVFVGAGPHSLACLTRLLEPTPDAGVDAPYRRVIPKDKVLRYWKWQRTCPSYRAALKEWLQAHVAVVDPAGAWMDRWCQQFSALGISHLRSTTAVHPDPLDSFALATFASSTGRTAELMPLRHIEKSPQFSGPFAVPSTPLFEDFCKDLVHRYCLEDAVIRDKVAELTPVFEPHCAADTGLSGTTTVNSSTGQAAAAAGRRVQHWVVQLASGRQLLAKRVLVGIGSTNMPRVPPAFRGLQAVQDLNLDTQAPGKVTMLNNNNSSSSTGAPSGSASSSNRSNSTIDMNAARTCLPSSSSGDTTGDSSNSISNSNNSNGSIPGSDCCSGGCCDGACSNSSGWSDDSSATATTAAAGPQGARITTAASGGKAFGPAGNAGAAATAFSDGSTASSPRSTTGSGSLCSWLDLAGEQELSQLDKAAGGLCDTNQPQPLAAQADAISTADWPAACADAAPPLKTATGNSLAPGLVSAGEWDTTDDGSSSTGSSMVTFQEAASMQLEPDHSCDSTAAAATAAATAAGSSGVSAKRPAVELLLPSPGPCNWVSVSSSPTGSACDSLCSWLGCEHSLAKQLAADQQQQQVQQVRCETVAESTALLMSRLTLDASCSLQHHLQGEGQFSLSADGFLLGAAAAAADEAQMQLQPIRTDCSALAAAGAGAAAAAGTAIAATASGREERGAASPAGCGSSTNDAAVPLLNAASGTAAAATASHPSAQQTGGPSLAAVAAKGAAGAAAGPEQLSVLLGGPLDSGTFYPRGRLMHSWQLVEALQSAAGAAGGQQQQQQEAETPVAACPAASSSSSSARLSDPLHSSSSSTTDVRARGKARTARRQHSKSKSRSRSSTSKQQQGGAAASSSKYAVSAVATLLQQKGLAAPGESVLIMGGGLTTAHLAVLAAAAVGGEAPSNTSIPGMIGSASSKQDDGSTATSDSDSDSGSGSSGLVRLLLRGPSVRVKQFDVDLEWMGRNRGATLQFGFRQALSDMGDRLRLMRRVLQGGSITPEAAGVLDDLDRQGKLEVMTQADVVGAAWDWQQQRWDVWLEDGRELHAHRLWLATGSMLSLQEEPLLSSLLQHLPVPAVGGLPALQPSLEWTPGSAIYVLGAYAALQLGPGALNLAGAKTASVVMAQQLKPVLPELPAAVNAGVGGMLGAARQH